MTRRSQRNALNRPIMLAVALAFTATTMAQVQFDGGATIDFTGFTGGGFAPEPAPGQLDSDTWSSTGFQTGSVPFGGTATSGDAALGASNGGVNQGGIYAFNVAADNPALGVQPTGSDFTPGAFVLAIQNVTGAPLTSIDVSYVAYYRNDQPRGNSFNFSWSTTNSNFQAIPDLDLISPDLASGGAWIANPRTTTLSGFNIPDGGLLYLRWSGADVSGSSNRDEFALDDIVLGTGGEPMGACYAPDFFTCTFTTADECIAQGGSYSGDGTTCPPPTGACCEGTVCSGGITESECLGVGGNYRGDDTTCEPGVCEPGAGACCLSIGGCQSVTSPADCCAFGGTYLGEGSTCTPTACDQLVDLDTTRSLSDGTVVTIENVVLVTDADLIASATFKSLTVQDLSGTGGTPRGYTIFGSNTDIDAILAQASLGDVVSISGTTGSFNGLRQLVAPYSGVQVCNSTTLPAPAVITVADMQEGSATGEELESVLVTLSCVTFDDAGNVFAGGANYNVTDTQSSLTALVRVQTTTLDLVGQTIPSGPVEITGVLSQYDTSDPRDGGYQLLPISINNINACAAATDGACCVTSSAGACPTCAGDMNGDDAIDTADISDFVNAMLGRALGNPSGVACANTDLDGNGDVNGLDLQSFIGLVMTHATCSTSCAQTTFNDCDAMGGTFSGTGTTCATNPCAP